MICCHPEPLELQEPLAGIVPPLKVSDVAPAPGAQVPPQVVAAAGVAATCTSAGSPSMKAAPVRAVALVFASVKVSVETALTAIGSGEKAFASVGLIAAAQPVMFRLSIERSAPGLVWLALNP